MKQESKTNKLRLEHLEHCVNKQGSTIFEVDNKLETLEDHLFHQTLSLEESEEEIQLSAKKIIPETIV